MDFCVLWPILNSNLLENSFRINKCIDLFHNGDRIKYSFVLMQMSLSNLTAVGEIQENI